MWGVCGDCKEWLSALRHSSSVGLGGVQVSIYAEKLSEKAGLPPTTGRKRDLSQTRTRPPRSKTPLPMAQACSYRQARAAQRDLCTWRNRCRSRCQAFPGSARHLLPAAVTASFIAFRNPHSLPRPCGRPWLAGAWLRLSQGCCNGVDPSVSHLDAELCRYHVQAHSLCSQNPIALASS